MSVNLEMKIDFNASETFSASSELAEERAWDHELNFVRKLKGNSVVPVQKVWSDQFNLSSGTYSIDLTGLTDVKGDSLDFTGLKVQLIAVKCPGTNTDTVTVDVGSSNGYEFGGESTSEITLTAGGVMVYFSPDKLDDVSTTAKTIDLSSSDQDATVKMLIVAG